MFGFIVVPRLRTLLALVALVVVGMLLLHPDADAAPDDPALPPPVSERGSAAGQTYTPPTTAAETAFWSQLGVAVGQPAPPGWVTGDGEGDVGPYFGDDIEGEPGRVMPDGTVLMVGSDELPTVVAHSAEPVRLAPCVGEPREG
jgi:hypothetical protein